MSFRFIWIEADTQEELEMVKQSFDKYICSDDAEVKKSVKSRSDINHENYERRKEKSEKSLKKT